MPIGVESLRQELETAEKRLSQARHKREEAERDEKKIEAERDAYKTLLGLHGSAASGKASESVTTAPQIGVSQRTLMKDTLNNAGPRGLKPAELYKLVKDAGVKRNYVHSTLFRWKENGEVVEKNGRYTVSAVQ